MARAFGDESVRGFDDGVALASELAAAESQRERGRASAARVSPATTDPWRWSRARAAPPKAQTSRSARASRFAAETAGPRRPRRGPRARRPAPTATGKRLAEGVPALEQDRAEHGRQRHQHRQRERALGAYAEPEQDGDRRAAARQPREARRNPGRPRRVARPRRSAARVRHAAKTARASSITVVPRNPRPMTRGLFVQCSTASRRSKPIAAVGRLASRTTSASRPAEDSLKRDGRTSAGTPAATARPTAWRSTMQGCDERARVEHHVEREPALVELEEELGEREVAVARDRKKLRHVPGRLPGEWPRQTVRTSAGVVDPMPTPVKTRDRGTRAAGPVGRGLGRRGRLDARRVPAGTVARPPRTMAGGCRRRGVCSEAAAGRARVRRERRARLEPGGRPPRRRAAAGAGWRLIGGRFGGGRLRRRGRPSAPGLLRGRLPLARRPTRRAASTARATSSSCAATCSRRRASYRGGEVRIRAGRDHRVRGLRLRRRLRRHAASPAPARSSRRRS